MGGLYNFTFAINFLALVLALWLGIYLVTRNPRYLIAWLTALTVWSLSSLFLNVLLAINPPPLPGYQAAWLRFMFPFWPITTLTSNPNNWLLGWAVAPAIAFWHHVTTLMRPGRLNAWRWTRIVLGYLLALLAILVQSNGTLLYAVKENNPLYLNSLHSGVWFPIFGAALFVLTFGSVMNLFRSMSANPKTLHRKQLLLLVIASVVAGLVAPVAMAGALLELPIPMLVISLLLGVAVGIIGFGVARYSALVAGRVVQHDFVYNLVGLTLITLIYLLASLFLVRLFDAPSVTVVFVPLLAVITHSLMSTGYRLMDWLFYRKETRQLRSNLQHLIRRADEVEAMEDSLAPALNAICSSVRASFGLIMAFEDQNVRQLASFHWKDGQVPIEPAYLVADDFIHINPGQFPHPLEDVALLVPLYDETEQLGAILLGHPINGVRFSDEDVNQLLGLSDRIEDLIYFFQRKNVYTRQIAQLAETKSPMPAVDSAFSVPVGVVEACLRNMFDYSFLGATSLGEMNLVLLRLAQEQMTTVDRGKIVHEVLLEAINKLRPNSAISRDPPPREWYPYLILRDAYLEEKSNRDIMLNLYISEGTFNRTRRSAIRSVARTVSELEAALA